MLIFNVFQAIAIIILVDAQIVPSAISGIMVNLPFRAFSQDFGIFNSNKAQLSFPYYRLILFNHVACHFIRGSSWWQCCSRNAKKPAFPQPTPIYMASFPTLRVWGKNATKLKASGKEAACWGFAGNLVNCCGTCLSSLNQESIWGLNCHLSSDIISSIPSFTFPEFHFSLT